MKWLLLGSCSLLFIACSGGDAGSTASSLCSKFRECAEKAGTGFSETECKNNFTEEAEKADTQGCGDQYDEYATCIGDIDLTCSDSFEKAISAECGSKAKAVSKCTGSSVTGGDSCKDAADRIRTKYEECGIRTRTSDEESTAECTDAAGDQAEKVATCVEQTPCQGLSGEDQDSANRFAECLGQ